MSVGLGPEWVPIRKATQEDINRRKPLAAEPVADNPLGPKWVALGPPINEERKAELDRIAGILGQNPGSSILQRGAAKQVTPEERAQFEQMLYEHVKRSRPQEKLGFGESSAHTVLKGMEKIVESTAQYFVPETKMSDEEHLFRNRLQAIQEGNDPMAGEDAPWYKSGYYGALEQAPKMGLAMVAGSVAGTAAGFAGLGSLGVNTAQAAGVGASYYTQMRDDTYYELIASGVEPKVARRTAAVSAILQATIEGGFVANPYAKRMGSEAVSRTVRDVILSNMKRFGGEWSEEFAQSLVDETAKAIVTGDKGAIEVAKTSIKDGLDALPSLVYLAGGPMVVGGTAEAAGLREQERQRVADIKKWIETGYIPAEIGKGLKVKGDTRAERMADAKAQLADAKQRVERAKKLPREERKVEDAVQVGKAEALPVGATPGRRAEVDRRREEGQVQAQKEAQEKVPVARTDLLPAGWKMEVGRTRTKEGHTFEAEVDWAGNRVVFSDQQYLDNPEIINHEIAHVVIEEMSGKDRLFDDYIAAKSEEWKSEGHETEWIVKDNFHREEIAMEYGNYLNGKPISDEVRAVFESHLPGQKPPVTPTEPTVAEEPVAPPKAPQKPVQEPEVTPPLVKPLLPPGGRESRKGAPPIQRRTGPSGRGKPTSSTGEIVARLSDIFGFPIRTGHFRGGPKRKSIYKEKEGVARTGVHGDIDAATYGIARHLDTKKRPLEWLPAVLEPELGKLDYESDRGDIHEGFAEYMRLRLTTDSAATAAPKFHKWFEEWLDNNPEIKDQVTAARDTIGQWQDTTAVERVKAQVNRGESRWKELSTRLKPKNVVDWIQNNWINRLRPLFKASKEMTGARTQAVLMDEMPADLNFWAFAKASNISAAAKARGWAHEGTADVAGNKVGPGLKETFSPIAEELRDPETLQEFYAYAYARHALTLHDQHDAALQQWKDGGEVGQPPQLKDPGIGREDAHTTVAEFDSRPGWKKASDGLTSWHNDLIDYLADAGGLPQEAAETMKDMYPNYISLSRHFDTEAQQGGAGGGRLANLPKGVHRLKGSGRQIMPPLESALGYAERIIGIADKVRVGKMLVEASKKYDTLGDTVEQVDPKDVAQSTRLRNIERQLKDAGADLSQADMDSLLTVFSQEFTGDAKDNILILYEDGKPQLYQVRPDLYRAMMAVDKPARMPEVVNQTLGRVARAVRLGTTGLKPGFSLITNVLRDIGTATMQTEYQKRNPFSIALHGAQGIVEEITNTEAAQVWKRGGGPMAQPLGIDRKFLKETVQELMAQSPKAKALNWAKHPVDSLRNLFQLPEGGPRLAEFRAALESLGWKEGQDVTFEQFVKGQLAAANVTVDFREAGWMAQWINQITPFFNATIQGPHRMASAIHNHPKATISSAVMSLTIPSLLLWWRQKDEEWYKDLNPMERYRYWHARIPGTDTILRIPKPFEWGHIFSSMPEALAQSIYDEDPEALGESFETMLEDANPFTMVGPVPLPMPGLAEPPIEIAANKDFFFDRPLVSERLQDLESQDQYAPYTTATGKAIGRMLGVSPIYVEHLASGWTGGLATQAVSGVETLAGVTGKKTGRRITGGASTLPVVGRLFLSPLHTRQFDDFYTRLEKLEQKHASLKLKDKSDPSITMLKFMRDRVKDLAELRNESREVLANKSLTDDQKRDQFINIHLKMVQMAREANEMSKLDRPSTDAAIREQWDELHTKYSQDTIYNAAKPPPERVYYKGRPENLKKAQKKYIASRELEKHRALAVADTHQKAQQMLFKYKQENNLKPATYAKRGIALAKLYGLTEDDFKKFNEENVKTAFRRTGEPKGKGWLGTIELPGGGVASEYTIDVGFDGKETEIPTLVPTLTKAQIERMRTDIIPNKKQVPKAIKDKAVAHALKRMKQGKSVFVD